MAYVNEETGVSYAELIAGPEIPVLTANVAVTKGTAVKRGTLMSIADGVAAATATGDTAVYVLAKDVADTDEMATVYTSGRFNREKLIAAEGDTAAAHEAELRTVGIYMGGLK